MGDYKPGDLKLRHSYRLTLRSTSGLKDYEVHDQMEYQGDMSVWFPDSRTSSVVDPRPVFINRAIPRLISVAYEDILEAELH